MQAGDTKEFTVKFPEEYSNDKLSGLEISFQVTLHEIREEVLPPIDDELAKKTGQFESLDALKKVITENLEQGYAKRIEQELHEQIFAELIARSDFEVPDVMVDMELEGIINEAERSFSYRNMTFEDAGLSRESIAAKYRDTALKQVKRHLILERVAEQEHLTIADDELEQALSEMAANFNQPVEQIKEYYNQNKDKLEFFKHTLLEKKAINLIIESSRIEDVEPEKDAAQDEGSQPAAAEF
jgi:trigger factor